MFASTLCMQYGTTALHYRVIYKVDESIMRLLLEHKADPNVADEVPHGEGEGSDHIVERVHGGGCGVRWGLV